MIRHQKQKLSQKSWKKNGTTWNSNTKVWWPTDNCSSVMITNRQADKIFVNTVGQTSVWPNFFATVIMIISCGSGIFCKYDKYQEEDLYILFLSPCILVQNKSRALIAAFVRRCVFSTNPNISLSAELQCIRLKYNSMQRVRFNCNTMH